MVDRGKLRWDDRVVDLYPEFKLKDPWVTREFRVFDVLVFLSPARRKRDVGAAVANGDRM